MAKKHRSKKKNKRMEAKIAEQNELAAKKAKQRAAFKKNKKYILPLVLNTVIFFAVYSYLVTLPSLAIPTLWVYFGLTAAFCLAYIIYNRGFSRMNVTVEMLPNSMSLEEKQAFIDEAKTRLEKSKWMLTIIFPLLMTFIIDILNMYIIEPMLELSDLAALYTTVCTVL